MKVFLGGTCGDNHWREDIVIPGLLERGVSQYAIFNPVVPNWTPADQEREDAAKSDPGYLLLFVIASPDPSKADVTEVSAYSLVEVTRAALKSPDRTVVLVDVTGLARRTAKTVLKATRDWHEDAPDMPVFLDYEQLLDELARRLREKEHD
jgi:hypothetical protein